MSEVQETYTFFIQSPVQLLKKSIVELRLKNDENDQWSPKINSETQAASAEFYKTDVRWENKLITALLHHILSILDHLFLSF